MRLPSIRDQRFVRIEASGAVFFPLSGGADFDPVDPFARVPELKVIPPGLESSTIFHFNMRGCRSFC
jgi:hypothetical protein